FEKLGISLNEQKMLTGVAVDAVLDSVSVKTTYQKVLEEKGIIFCSFSEAILNHPELVRKYMGSVVPYGDNYFAALNSAVFTDGSFCYIPKGIRFIAINSNDVSHYPDDAPDKMRTTALELGYPFPYLFDETQEVAMAYQAKCTPDFFVFDDDCRLVYRGQLDDSRLGNNIKVSGKSIRTALDSLLAKEAVDCDNQKPSLGCNIKWKPENA
ncbi:MAG: redoxin domain-containing protein, partial [Planctomycetota bacterium]